MKRYIPYVVLTCALGLGSIKVIAETKNETGNEAKKMDYKVEAVEMAAQPALVIKGKARVEEVGPAIGKILAKIETYLTNKKSKPAGPPFTRTFSFKNGILEFESGFPVSSKIAGQGEIIGTELPRGSVATTSHVGSQETSQDAYEAIHAWIRKNGKKEAGAPWEVYLTDPASTPPEKSKMQIFFPIK